MLYVSTRNRTDSFTAYRTLHENTAADGGLFVPYRLPVYSKEEISQLSEKTFGDTVAWVLRTFFSVPLSGWDVDFTIGRHPYRLVEMNHRLCIAELWRNLKADYGFLEESIYAKITGKYSKPTDWAKIAIRISVLFGLYGEQKRNGTRTFDISVASGDFMDPIAAWYAKQMGLPIGTIICCCNDNSGLWDLLHRGEFSAGNAVVKTELTKLDVVCPASLERLIYESLGIAETKRYLDVCASRGTYQLDSELLERVSRNIAATVVSQSRCQSLIRNIYRTHNYIADPYTAVAFGGLQDYRSGTGEGRTTLLLSDASPVSYLEMIEKATGLSEPEINKRLNNA